MSHIPGMCRLFLSALLLAVVTADGDMAMDMSKVKILAKSGEIQFRRQLGDASTLTDPVKIKIAKVIQIVADDTEAVSCSPVMSLNPVNMFDDFANKVFSIKPVKNAQPMPNAGDMKASMTTFSADLGSNVGKLSIDLALAEGDGQVSLAGEIQTLKKGDMKFTMELSDWKWCGTAGSNGAAAFLDVYIEVTASQTPTIESIRNATAPAMLDLGDAMKMSFSGKLKKDSESTWTAMETGFPKMDTQNKSVIVRFPRFESKLVYDPTVTAAEATDNGFQDMAMGMSKVKILSNAGEMEFRRQLGDASTLTDPVKIKIAQVVQVDSSGSEVSTCSSDSSFLNPIKKFTGFAGKAFKIAAKRLSQTMENGGTMKATMTKFSANLGADVGQLAIDLALPKENGHVSIVGEIQKLKVGDMKFNMELSEWNWCGVVGASGAATSLDVYIEVKSKQHPVLTHNASDVEPAAFELGDNMTMSFSRKFKKDSENWANMIDGYPKIDPVNPIRFIVRFPRFANKTVYDPSVTVEDDDGPGGDDSAASGVKVSIAVTALAAIMAFAPL